MKNPEIKIEGLYFQLLEEWIEPGVYDDDAIPLKKDLFDFNYSLTPVDFTYEGSSVYGIYCLVQCNDPAAFYPYIKAHLVKGRRERKALETKHTPMWQDKKYPKYFAYRYSWPSQYENWREPGTYTLELCIGFKSTGAHIGSKPTWLIKSCEENEPKDTSDNPNKFKFTVTRYNKR